MFDVVDAIARAVARDLGVQVGAADYARFDEALRKNEPVRLFGQPLPLERYLLFGQRVADNAVTALRRRVQNGTDIDPIVLDGGSAFFFADAVARTYPRHALTSRPEAFHASCRGFQIAGLQQGQAELRRIASTRVGTR